MVTKSPIEQAREYLSSCSRPGNHAAIDYLWDVVEYAESLERKDGSLKDLLLELEEYFDQRADGEQFPDSPRMQVNEEMNFLERIRKKANEFHWRHVIKGDKHE